MKQLEPIGKSALELRQEFDAVFTRPAQPRSADFADFLAIRLAGVKYAVRLTDTSGLFQNRKITPLPSEIPGLLGIAGFRGTAIPVYSLRVFMGHPRNGTAKWMFLTPSNIAFVFDELDAYTRISRDAVLPANLGATDREHVCQFVRVEGVIRPVADLPSILDSIRAQIRPSVFNKE
jgi:chemotaxis signal transduction protein